tara:strand:- start:462 stop:818 length:357 start_codon:yes stop_codon:yes gene_type:complete
MNTSSPRLKALAVTAGFSLWCFIISTSLGVFSFELFAVFVSITFIVTQLFAIKLSKGLEIFAMINTKIFLGILFIFVISIYGIFFRVLRIDLLRLNNNSTSFWLKNDKIKQSKMETQY